MFAALTVARLREAVFDTLGLRDVKSWVSPDEVSATELPLAKSTVKVLESMHSVLEKTLQARNAELTSGSEGSKDEKEENLRKSKAAEVRLVRNARFLREPAVRFLAREWRREDLPVSLQ